MPTKRDEFLDLQFDRLSFADVKRRLAAVTAESPYGYLVTPNVDHVVRLHREPALREIWNSADICVCDSQILRRLARLVAIRLELVRGSDTCAALFDALVRDGDRIAIVGGSRDQLTLLEKQFPMLEFMHHEPPMGLLTNAAARQQAAAFVAGCGARFVIFAVGSPQQEMIAREVRRFAGATGFALCIGAGLDFVTGNQKRAPRLFQSLGLEWAHRLLANPRRLWRRYLVDGMEIVPIFLDWRQRQKARA